METVSGKDSDICSKCKKTLQSLDSFKKANLVEHESLRALPGSWFYCHWPTSTFFNTPAVENDGEFETTAKYLVKSASTCPFCSFLLSTLSPTWSKIWKQQDRPACLSQMDIDQVAEELGDNPIYLRWSYLGDNWTSRALRIARPGNFENTITLYFDHDPHSLCDRIGERLSVLASSNCPEAFDFIRKQAKNCHSQHATCHGQQVELGGPPKLPTRVLDLDPASGSKEVKLLETCSVMFGFYAALSHCWGPENKRPLTTEKATIEKRKLGIDWNDLPQTFQDAIVTSRAIGIQYLWIDSLCIIQDDTDDWHRESANMADVYTNAWVTIAASYAHDSTEGLFDACYRPSIELLDVPSFNTTGIRSGSNYFGAVHGLVGGPRGHVGLRWTVSQPDLEVLSTRGWTTQEALLSRCIVYFTRHFLFWSCRTLSIDEKGVEYHPKTSPRQRNDTWYRVVDEFSKRSLKYPTDKLIALGGILSHFWVAESHVYGEEFAFRHWTKHLPNSLLWSTGQANRHLNPLIMPTWSWASSMSSVNWLYWPQNLESRCEVVALPTSSESQIVLRGKLKVLAEARSEIRRSGGRTAGPGYQFDGASKDGPIYGCLVAICKEDELFSKEDRSQILMLQRMPAGENTYERVGMVIFWSEEWFEDCPLQEITLV